MTASTRKGTLDLSPNAITVLERRYLVKDDQGKPVEQPVAPVRLGNGAGDAPEQVFGLLDRLSLVVLHQVAPLQHGDGVGAQIERPLAGGSGHAGLVPHGVSWLTKRLLCLNLTRARD